jgi:hypothetical protein
MSASNSHSDNNPSNPNTHDDKCIECYDVGRTTNLIQCKTCEVVGCPDSKCPNRLVDRVDEFNYSYYCIKCSIGFLPSKHFLRVCGNHVLSLVLGFVDLHQLQECRTLNRFLKSFVKPSKHYHPTWISLKNYSDVDLFMLVHRRKTTFSNLDHIIMSSFYIIDGLEPTDIRCRRLTVTPNNMTQALGLFRGYTELTIQLEPNKKAGAICSSLKLLANYKGIKRITTLKFDTGDGTKLHMREFDNAFLDKFKYTDIKFPGIKSLSLPSVVRLSSKNFSPLFDRFPDLEEIEFAYNQKLIKEGNDWCGEEQIIQLTQIKTKRTWTTMAKIEKPYIAKIEKPYIPVPIIYESKCNQCSCCAVNGLLKDGNMWCYSCAIKEGWVIDDQKVGIKDEPLLSLDDADRPSQSLAPVKKSRLI